MIKIDLQNNSVTMSLEEYKRLVKAEREGREHKNAFYNSQSCKSNSPPRVHGYKLNGVVIDDDIEEGVIV